MKKHGIALKLTTLAAVGALALGGVVIALADEIPHEQTGTVTITDIHQLDSFFHDATFQQKVFDAVKDGQEGAVGTTVEEALGNFYGRIDASGMVDDESVDPKDPRNIQDAWGMQFLRSAAQVNITYNNISDLSFLDKKATINSEGDVVASNEEDKEYYFGQEHYGDGTNTNKHNVTWHLEGNPLRVVPLYFGGRLVVKQAATDYSEYPEDNGGTYSYVRGNEPFLSGTFLVGRIKDVDGNWRDLDHTTIQDISGDPQLNLDEVTDNNTLRFSNLTKSGQHEISVGMTQIFNYSTQDGKGTLTPGGQSFKYYLYPSFYVYDKVKLTQSPFKGAVQLTKTDEAGTTKLEGAVYDLYLDGSKTPVQTGLTTGPDGTLTVNGLDTGSYYFKETKAPDGYIVSPDLVEFTIDSPHTTLGGGKKTIDGLENSGSITAGNDETFIAGPIDGDRSPDITLTLDSGEADEVENVVVTYSKLDDGGQLVRSFSTVEAAAADVNNEKNANTIVGPVSVEVNYGAQDDTTAVQAVTATNTLAPTPPAPPEEPDEPGTPDMPSDPEEPGKPGTPDAPNEPGTPGTPADLGKPNEPDTPGTPADPGKPGKPKSPTPTPSTTTIPATGDAVPVATLIAMLGATCLALGVALRKLHAKKR